MNSYDTGFLLSLLFSWRLRILFGVVEVYDVALQLVCYSPSGIVTSEHI